VTWPVRTYIARGGDHFVALATRAVGLLGAALDLPLSAMLHQEPPPLSGSSWSWIVTVRAPCSCAVMTNRSAAAPVARPSTFSREYRCRPLRALEWERATGTQDRGLCPACRRA
jgi:hypothetical protein